MGRLNKEIPSHILISTARLALTIYTLKTLGDFAFGRGVKKQIMNRGDGKCETGCGSLATVASHIQHHDNGDSNNGMASCDYHEAMLHVTHAFCGRALNLSPFEALRSAKGHLTQLRARGELQRLYWDLGENKAKKLIKKIEETQV